METRSLIAYEYYRDAALRFDYFVTGLIGALSAYIGQTIHPQKIGFNPSTHELLAFLILVVSLFFCFKRLEKNIIVFKLNHQSPHLAEQKGELMQNFDKEKILNKLTGEIFSREEMDRQIGIINKALPQIESELEKVIKEAKNYYDYRNWLMLGGFILIVLSKVWSAYN